MSPRLALRLCPLFSAGANDPSLSRSISAIKVVLTQSDGTIYSSADGTEIEAIDDTSESQTRLLILLHHSEFDPFGLCAQS